MVTSGEDDLLMTTMIVIVGAVTVIMMMMIMMMMMPAVMVAMPSNGTAKSADPHASCSSFVTSAGSPLSPTSYIAHPNRTSIFNSPTYVELQKSNHMHHCSSSSSQPLCSAPGSVDSHGGWALVLCQDSEKTHADSRVPRWSYRCCTLRSSS